ncbi:MAG: glycosyltransferase family 4 protein [Ignavibacteriaceae bacterium]
MKKKSIVLVAYNSESSISYSGIEYYIKCAFNEANYKVISLNIKNYINIPSKLFLIFLSKPVRIYYRLIKKVEISYSFYGSLIYRMILTLFFFFNKKTLKKSDLIFMFTAPYGLSKSVQNPIIVYSDGSIKWLIKWQRKRDLVSFEENLHKKNYKAMKRADLIIALFNEVKKEADEYFKDATKTIYFGTGLNLPKLSYSQSKLLNNKFNNQLIIFIGRKHYLDGAHKLLEANKIIKKNKRIVNYKIYIIGLKKELLTPLDENVTIIEFINKNDVNDIKFYSDLLASATLFVNPSSIGGAYMATLEALYYHTPVVLTQYPEINSFFNDKEKPGLLIRPDLSPLLLADEIENIMGNAQIWLKYSNAASKISNELGWDKLISHIENRFN